MKRAFFGSLMPMSRRIAGTNAIRACEENRGQTGEFPFFRLRISLTGKKGIHQSDPDFPAFWATIPAHDHSRQAREHVRLDVRARSERTTRVRRMHRWMGP